MQNLAGTAHLDNVSKQNPSSMRVGVRKRKRDCALRNENEEATDNDDDGSEKDINLWVKSITGMEVKVKNDEEDARDTQTLTYKKTTSRLPPT